MINIPEWPIANEKEEKALLEVLYSHCWWRNPGTQVKQFDKEFSEYHECKGGISVSNGTVALEIALKALNIKEGDEVIVPDFTFYSTVSAVLAVKAIPVIVDVLPDTFCIDSEQVRRAITNKTKAIIPVHIAGHICDMEKIMQISKEHKLYVIEDCSHAHGAVWKNKKAGSFGTVATFSFQNAKLMTAGEGGIVLANDENLLNRILLESNCGRAENDIAYQHVLVGTNARLSEFQGAILRSQLKRVDAQIKIRSENYRYLSEKLSDIKGIYLQSYEDDMNVHPHYMVMFYYDSGDFSGATRDEFVSYLKNKGIGANRSYESLHKLPVFKNLDKNSWRVIYTGDEQCMCSEKISNQVVCLPHNILLGDKKLMDQIIEVIKEFKNR